MTYRGKLATWLLNMARLSGRMLGCEIDVTINDHKIKTKMEVPSKSEKAWDPDFYSKGNLFRSGYANPIKPTADQNGSIEDPDEIDVVESDVDENGAQDDVTMISSQRYQMFMMQDLISQMLNPKEEWEKIVYAMILVAFLLVINLMVNLKISGAF